LRRPRASALRPALVGSVRSRRSGSSLRTTMPMRTARMLLSCASEKLRTAASLKSLLTPLLHAEPFTAAVQQVTMPSCAPVGRTVGATPYCTFISTTFCATGTGVGAAGGKRLAHRVEVDDLANTTHDPLLAALRLPVALHLTRVEVAQLEVNGQTLDALDFELRVGGPDPLLSLPKAKAKWQGADLSNLEPAEMERLLADTVLKEFKVRLARIGLEYQTPARP
jgi:hypothetical protein